jgi:hypothetical protein
VSQQIGFAREQPGWSPVLDHQRLAEALAIDARREAIIEAPPHQRQAKAAGLAEDLLKRGYDERTVVSTLKGMRVQLSKSAMAEPDLVKPPAPSAEHIRHARQILRQPAATTDPADRADALRILRHAGRQHPEDEARDGKHPAGWRDAAEAIRDHEMQQQGYKTIVPVRLTKQERQAMKKRRKNARKSARTATARKSRSLPAPDFIAKGSTAGWLQASYSTPLGLAGPGGTDPAVRLAEAMREGRV